MMSMNRKAWTLSVSLLAVSVSIIFFGSFPLSGEGSKEFPITSDPNDQRCPAIYGDIVVWQDSRNGNWDIYGYNLSTGEEFPITEAPGNQGDPAIYDNYVVWVDYREGGGALYGYDLVTKEEVLITTGPGFIRGPAIYSNIVVWADERTGDYDIFGCNLSTRQEFQITTAPEWQFKPAIYQNIVVWEDRRHKHSAIYGYNLSTGREFRISERLSFSSSHDQYDPALYGNVVVWRDSRDTLYGSNLSTSKNYKIAILQNGECDHRGCSLWLDSGGPVIYEDAVIWVDCRYGNADILGYNFSTDQEFEVTTCKSCQCSSALYGTTVVWEDNRKGNWDIYGTKLIPPLTPTQFTPRTSVLDSGELFTAVFAGCAVLVMVYIGTVLWYVKKFALSETTKLSAAHWRDFGGSGNYVLSPVLLAVFYGILGPLYIFMLDSLVGCVGLLIPVMAGFDSFWRKKIPYIRTTADEIMLFPRRPGNPVTMAWNTIQKAHVEVWTDIPSSVQLFLSNGKKVKIDLYDISGKDREDFIQTLKQFIK